MKKISKIIGIVIFIVSMVGCTLTRGSSVLIGNSRPATDPSAVKIYMDPPKKYDKIAIVTSDSRNAFASDQNLTNHAIDRLKKEAAAVGANGVLIQNFGNSQIGSTGVVVNNGGPIYTGVSNNQTGKEAKGIAIFVIEE